jgi:hypothetical protein
MKLKIVDMERLFLGLHTHVLEADYMENFQPGLNFSPAVDGLKRVE